MSHYDIKLLAWLSTNLLLSHKSSKRKSDFAGLFEEPAGDKYDKTHTSISERMGGPVYGAMVRQASGKPIFDGLWVKKDAPIYIVRKGWEEPIYIKWQGALRRSRLLRGAIWNEYGSYAPHTVSYLADMSELGKVWLNAPFEYAISRDDAAKGIIRQVGEHDEERCDSYALFCECFVRPQIATIVDLGSAWTIVRYTWDAKQHAPVQHPIATCPIFTEDGHTFRVQQTWFPANTYATKELCVKANEQVDKTEGNGPLPVVE